MTDWHRLFGLVLTDYFTDSPYEVELEVDLSKQQQILDIIIIRKRPGKFTRPLPDGFGELANHNLLTFKSHQDSLDAWALHELIGFYVAYRKFVSPATNELLPDRDFRLLAVSVRYPKKLHDEISLHKVGQGGSGGI